MRRLPTSQHEDRLQAALPKAGDQGLRPDADLGGALTPVAAGGVEFGIPTGPRCLLPEASFPPSPQLLSGSDFLGLKYGAPLPHNAPCTIFFS